MTTIIDISLKDGRKVSGQADFGKGSPANPMSYDEVAEKFRETAGLGGLARNRIEDVIAMVRDLETLGSIDRLLSPLRF
jgi:2-methylcitrate dehydratase PrpD